MKVSVVAIPHPEFDNLFLHGKRKDNKKWTLPGGGANSRESAKDCAIRELFEETGIKSDDLKYWGKRTYDKNKKTIEVSLFIGKCPKNLNLKIGNDPDKEMVHFKFLDPLIHGNMHIPAEWNILRDYVDGSSKKTK